MATEAQVQANRANAQKSTGPRSPAGKAAVAQNAVTHGLAGRRDVIKGEDQGQFDRHRAELLKELKPDGAVESMLAERAVSLSWRLERVGRVQNEVFDALLAEGATAVAKLLRSMTGKKSEEDEELALGRAVIKDFANSRVLDRLLMYERRIESSLLKTLNDLQLRRLRVREYISRQMDELDSSGAADACEAGYAGLGRGPDARAARAEPAPDLSGGCPRHDADKMSATRMTQDSGIRPFQDSIAGPDGPDADRISAPRMSQDSAVPSFRDSADGPVAAELSCKTKPICAEPRGGQVACGTEVMNIRAENGLEETNPIRAGAEVEDGRTLTAAEEVLSGGEA